MHFVETVVQILNTALITGIWRFYATALFSQGKYLHIRRFQLEDQFKVHLNLSAGYVISVILL